MFSATAARTRRWLVGNAVQTARNSSPLDWGSPADEARNLGTRVKASSSMSIVSYTPYMSKRLQVVVADDELEGYTRVARVSGLTLSEWVRQTLRREQREISLGDIESKLEVVRRAASLNLGPETDIETMLAEIEAGYEQDLPGL